MTSLGERKAELRARMRAVRAAIPPEERTALARRVEERLMELPSVQGARCVLVFSSFGSEVSTTGIAARLRANDGGAPRRLLLPYLRGQEMRAADYLSEEELIPSSYGPREPERPEAADPLGIDVAIVPGLAFDRRGYRVGYGGGHFDRYLALMRRDAVRIGIAFHAQLVDEVPNGPEDQPVDILVTDRETIACSPR